MYAVRRQLAETLPSLLQGLPLACHEQYGIPWTQSLLYDTSKSVRDAMYAGLAQCLLIFTNQPEWPPTFPAPFPERIPWTLLQEYCLLSTKWKDSDRLTKCAYTLPSLLVSFPHLWTTHFRTLYHMLALEPLMKIKKPLMHSLNWIPKVMTWQQAERDMLPIVEHWLTQEPVTHRLVVYGHLASWVDQWELVLPPTSQMYSFLLSIPTHLVLSSTYPPSSPTHRGPSVQNTPEVTPNPTSLSSSPGFLVHENHPSSSSLLHTNPPSNRNTNTNTNTNTNANSNTTTNTNTNIVTTTITNTHTYTDPNVDTTTTNTSSSSSSSTSTSTATTHTMSWRLRYVVAEHMAEWFPLYQPSRGGSTNEEVSSQALMTPSSSSLSSMSPPPPPSSPLPLTFLVTSFMALLHALLHDPVDLIQRAMAVSLVTLFPKAQPWIQKPICDLITELSHSSNFKLRGLAVCILYPLLHSSSSSACSLLSSLKMPWIDPLKECYHGLLQDPVLDVRQQAIRLEQQQKEKEKEKKHEHETEKGSEMMMDWEEEDMVEKKFQMLSITT
ncbi:hypothetical protein HMI55_003311 [Coelomomyces lativittatus]|nr:hypothetical protein HMI55_003311 [Coelomomyces lativittatus]